MFHIRVSYAPNFRIFAPVDNDRNMGDSLYNIHEYLKSASIWGGSDKREEIDGTIYAGYEMSMGKITHFLNLWSEGKLPKQVDG